MSGGSFNYLCHKDIYDLFNGTGEEWNDMLAELDILSPLASTEMRKIKEEIQRFREIHEKRWEALRPLLRAIEWWRSNDWSENDVKNAIFEYQKKVRYENL